MSTYFSELRRLHVEHPDTRHDTIYHCPVVFDRNANTIPALVRAADLTWTWSSLSGLYPGSPISIPMSVYSLSLALVREVEGWDADATSIGEDMHMLLKCFFHTNGRLITRTIYSAASQCNVTGDGTKSLCGTIDLSTVWARYQQALRHLWGSVDSGYFLRRSFAARRIINFKHFAIGHMLWQAHFMLPHFALMLILPDVIKFLAPHPLHPALLRCQFITGAMRLVSFIMFNVAFSLWDGLHAVAVATRTAEMTTARLSCSIESRCWYKPKHLAERCMVPLVGMAFGIMPAIVAQTYHLWTERMVYVTSAKPKVEMGAEDEKLRSRQGSSSGSSTLGGASDQQQQKLELNLFPGQQQQACKLQFAQKDRLHIDSMGTGKWGECNV